MIFRLATLFFIFNKHIELSGTRQYLGMLEMVAHLIPITTLASSVSWTNPSPPRPPPVLLSVCKVKGRTWPKSDISLWVNWDSNQDLSTRVYISENWCPGSRKWFPKALPRLEEAPGLPTFLKRFQHLPKHTFFLIP